jgi:hypothetical protein
MKSQNLEVCTWEDFGRCKVRKGFKTLEKIRSIANQFYQVHFVILILESGNAIICKE